MAKLERDPAYHARRQKRDQQFEEARAHYSAVAAPVLADLAAAGYAVEGIADLRQTRMRYSGAIPTLIHWLPRISDRPVKEDIVRTLSVPWARPMATPIMIKEFRSLPKSADPDGTGLRWAIGNALEVLADRSVLDELIEIAGDRRYGPARQMVVLGLARPRENRVIPALVALLDDEDVQGYAAVALGRLGARAARERLADLAEHAPKPWVRKEAKLAIAKLEKARLREVQPGDDL